MSGRSRRSWLPQWLRDRREERQLEKSIEQIGLKFRSRMAAAKTEQQEHDVDQEWTYEVEEYLDRLGVLRTKPLVKQATKWEVEIPQTAWSDDRYENSRYISPPEQVKLRRRIRDARRDAVRWWIQVLMPPLSLIVALVALLTGKC